MPAIYINPRFNFHNEYKKVQFINPYRFGISWRPEAAEWLLRADATGENRPVAFDGHFNTLVEGLIVDEAFRSQFDVLVNTRAGIGIGLATSKLNLVKDAYNALAVNSPSYIAGTGYSSDGATSYLRTQYTLDTAGNLFTRNDASFGVEIQGSVVFSCGATDNANLGCDMYYTGYQSLNDNYAGNFINKSLAVGYNLLTRSSSSAISFIQNSTKTDYTINTTGILNKEIYILRINQTIGLYSYPLAKIRLYHLGKFLSQEKYNKLQTRFNTFWSAVC
jgi:hypothetical protein